MLNLIQIYFKTRIFIARIFRQPVYPGTSVFLEFAEKFIPILVRFRRWPPCIWNVWDELVIFKWLV